MLTEEEKMEILHEIKQYPYPAGACIDALKIVQHYRGWVSDESIKDIAGILEISNEEVDGVATFYSRIYRKPVGRNVILLCDSISCMIMGYQSVYEYITKKLEIRFGETTPDGKFTLLPISCLGDCDHAPAMMINNDHYNHLSLEILEELLAQYR
jgi:NADH-quinone oxidoreductase subunit E